MSARASVDPFVALDLVGENVVTFRREASGETTLTLERRGIERRSLVSEALGRQLAVAVGAGTPVSLAAPVTVPSAGVARIVALLDEGVVDLLHLDLASRAVTPDGVRYLLSPFELRYAADVGRMHRVPRAGIDRVGSVARVVTDLHTHFAGCVGGDDLVALGLAHGVHYPVYLLEEAGVRVEAASGKAGASVALSDLSAEVRARLAGKLVVPFDRKVTFLEMERIYRLRGPITKHPQAFIPICRTIARDYRAMGIEHVELSLGSIVDREILAAVHREVPAIEDEHGVTIRFLVAISRHDDYEWDLDLIERIKALAGSVYVAGVDFMGHETSSTRAFASRIRAIAEWANVARPGFAVRVHAGESPSHPENVREAALATRGFDVETRIGHGLYGTDDETLDALREQGVVVEFNLDSNVALNHLSSARDVPLRRYLDRGVRIVLGSDGYGIYGTTPEAAVRAALIAGARPDEIGSAIRDAENEHIERARRRDASVLGARSSYVVPPAAPLVHYTADVPERKRKRTLARDAALAARFASANVVVTPVDRFGDLLQGRRVVSIAGAWRTSWEAMTPEDRERVRSAIVSIVAGLNPREDVIVTGGTREGVEGVAGTSARDRGFDVVAAVVRETPPDALDDARFNHVCVVAETLYDKAGGLYELVRVHGGVCLFFGGGQIVSDEIQTAANLRLQWFAMEGVVGASGRRALEQPDRAFATAEHALRLLEEARVLAPALSPHWFAGPNPTVDAVVVRVVSSAPEVLLVRRSPDAPAERGKWALPGGFVRSNAKRGDRWAPGYETGAEACLRELREEAGLSVEEADLLHAGVYEGGGRDPRDSSTSWSRTSVFAILLEGARATTLAIAGGDDAEDARWFPLAALPRELAFDHARILRDVLETLRTSSRARGRRWLP